MLLRALPVLLAVLAPASGQGADPQEAKRAGHERMVKLLAELGAEAYRSNPTYGRARLEALREELTRTDDGTPLQELLRLYPALGMQELFQGNPAAAVELLEKSYG